MDRRSFLAAAPAVALLPIGTSAGPAPPLLAERLTPAAPPNQAELERYYAFLWAEFRRLSDEMGVLMFDAMIMHSAGGSAAVHAAAPLPPSKRARQVLAVAGWSAP